MFFLPHCQIFFLVLSINWNNFDKQFSENKTSYVILLLKYFDVRLFWYLFMENKTKELTEQTTKSANAKKIGTFDTIYFVCQKKKKKPF